MAYSVSFNTHKVNREAKAEEMAQYITVPTILSKRT